MSNAEKQNSKSSQPRYIMIGGFLGAGKSTTILKLAEYLLLKGRKIGLITNDQSVGLVDTNVAESAGYVVEEISGGCFCCRFDSLVEAANRLTSNEHPDTFIAEPVGSCTDLVATVSYPLRRMYGDDYTIAPMSVLVDPIRAARVLGIESGKSFSPKVTYIYKKQLEEAQIIVINKKDLLDESQLAKLEATLSEEFPKADIVAVSARTGEGLEHWFDRIASEVMTLTQPMEVDYEVYAEGEALLGWLNATVGLSCAEPFDGEMVMMNVAEDIHRSMNASGYEIAHLKMTLMRQGGAGDVAVLNLVRNDFVPELAQSLYDQLTTGQLIINLRAEGPPEQLHAATLAALEAAGDAVNGLSSSIEHIEHFRPGKPVPTHRVESV